MKTHVYQERKRKQAIMIVLMGVFFGILYPILGKEQNDTFAIINGTSIGLIGGTFISYFELYLFNRKNRKIRFMKTLMMKIIIYTLFFTLLILIVISVSGSIESRTSYFSYLAGDAMRHFIFEEDFLLIIVYTLFLSGAIVFTHQISRKMGQKVLWNFVTGKYRKPREEERIFMFFDLNNSTLVAEKKGDFLYSQLLNDIFFDMTHSILSTYGEIYRYVGDEIVVSWKMKDGLMHANCIRCFFQAKLTIKRNREKYLDNYGFLPTFSAGFHSGQVIVGEIGDVKSQISYFGQVMYDTAEIEKKCKTHGTELLVSGDLLKKLSLPDLYEMKFAGRLETSKENSIDLYTINEVEMSNF